jgi:hypothetical protein
MAQIFTYNPNAYVPGQNRRNGVAQAIQSKGTKLTPYSNRAYVPGGATPSVASAIQAKGLQLGRAAANAGRGKGGGGGGGKTKVAQTWQDQLMSLYNSIYGNMETPAQQAARLQKGINSQIAAETAANRATLNETLAANREITRAQQVQLANQQARAMGFSRAIGSLQAQEGKQVYSDYERAAQNIQGLGTGLSGAVLDAQQVAADQVASGIEQASGGVNTARPSFDLEGLKNTTQYLGTTAPARDLFSEAANQAAAARLRNVASAQGIRNLAEDYGQKSVEAQGLLAGEQRKAQTTYSAEQRKLQATRPDLYAKAVEAARSGYRQDAATAVSALTLANTGMATQADIENAKLQTKIDQQTADAATAAATIKSLNDTIKANATAKNADTTASTATAKLTGYDKNGNLISGYFMPNGPKAAAAKYDANKFRVVTKPDGTQKLVPIPQPTTGGKGKGTPKLGNGQTVDQAYSTIDTRSADLNKAVLLAPFAQITNSYAVSKGREAPTYAPMQKSYQAAFNLALGKFPRVYRKNKELMAQMKSAIDIALAMAGYKVPG